MAIITISRGSFSGGKQLAENLARRLDYHCIDRDVVAQHAATHGVSPNDLVAALDTPPTSAVYTFNHKKYIYLVLVQAAIAEEVSAGNAVYHGLVGHRLFQGDFPALRVRVIAPIEYRLSSAQDRLHLNRAEALAYIEKMDAQRSKWTRYLHGVDWEDPSLYDLVLNLQHLSIEVACSAIAAVVKDGTFEFSPAHEAAMKDFLLATRVRAHLARDPLTSNLEVEVEGSAGQVTVRGDLCEQDDDVQRVAAAVPEVLAVKIEPPDVAQPS
jgi:cytidylate kinase